MSGAEFPFTSTPKDTGEEERQFHPISATILMDQELEEQVAWVVDDYLPVGGLVILAAKPKVGKTTLAYRLAVKVARGEQFLERSTMQGGVLILALEEHPRDVKIRLKELGGELDNIHLHIGSLEPTRANIAAVEAFVRKQGIRLVLVDTLAMFWHLDDESDASKMTQAVKPLLRLARDTGACVVLIHHHRKSDGEQGDEIRGSGALLASVDIAVRVSRDGTSGTRRVLKAVGRYADTPAELIIDLKNGEYLVIDPERHTKVAEQARLGTVLTPEGQTVEALAKLSGVPLTRVYRHMRALVGQGSARIEGKGVKRNPFLYSAVLDHSLSFDPLSLGTEVKEQCPESVLASS
ncbi:MAG: AAA family ATPase [Nitrospirota bacterium]